MTINSLRKLTMTSNEQLKHSQVMMPTLGLPLWLLFEGGFAVSVDMRSVFDALGMSWARWRLYLLGGMARLRVLQGSSRAGKKTLLMPIDNVARLLIELQNLLPNGLVSRNVEALLPDWQTYWADVRTQQRLAAAELAADKRGRKLEVDKVEEIYELFQERRHLKVIARQVRLSESVVKKVIAGTYPSFSKDALVRWTALFGKVDASRRHIDVSRSTITAELIQKVFVLHQEGYKPNYIAQCLLINVNPVNQIVRGTYKSRDPLAEAKWLATFGAPNAPENPVGAGLRRQKAQG